MSVEARSAPPAPDIVPPGAEGALLPHREAQRRPGGRSYGHWWVELDGAESYGWWPARAPLTTRDLLVGGPGVLNGMGTPAAGRPTCDPNHGLAADYEFHPVLVVPRGDDEVRNAVRRFAATFDGEWRWSVRPTMNCRLFQLCLFDAVGLVDGTGNYRTRGSGCPALAPLRRLAGRVTGRRHWPTNLPAPGHRVAAPLAAGARPPQTVAHPIRLGPS